MRGICGVFSPTQPDLAPPRILNLIGDTVAHRGESQHQHLDQPAGLGLAYFYRAAFVSRTEEPALPAWYEDDDLVVALDGSVDVDPPFDRPDGAGPAANASALAVYDAVLQAPESFSTAIDGVFDLAVWDRKRASIWLAENRTASKPFYYYYDASRTLLVFASEAKAIYAHPAVPVEVDPESLSIYLAASNLLPPLALVKGIRKCSPAST